MTKPSPEAPCNIEFDGHDWTELGPVFDLDIVDDNSMYAYIIQSRLWEAAVSIDGPTTGEVKNAEWQIEQVHRFIAAVGRSHRHGDGNVWLAISKIKSAWTFAQWVGRYLESAWT